MMNPDGDRRKVSLRYSTLFLMTSLLTLCLSVMATPAAAEFPARPVRIITPFAAGAGIDIVTRAVAQRLSQLWNQPVIVDNRPGAGATIGTAAVAKSPADGYTLLLGANTLAISPVVYPNLPYDARKDFIPITLLATSPEVLVVNAATGVGTVSELIARSLKATRKLNYGSAGSGTLAHLAGETFNRRTGMAAIHVAYKGATPALTALMASEVDWLFDSPSPLLPQIQAGKLRALAVAAAQRSPQLPEVPTLAESGFPDLDFLIWVGLMAPAGTPEAIVRQIESSVAEIMRDPALRTTLVGQGWDVVGSSSSEFAAFFERQMVKLGEAARGAGVKAD